MLSGYILKTFDNNQNYSGSVTEKYSNMNAKNVVTAYVIMFKGVPWNQLSW